jgi:hypothetical protein
MNKSLKDRLVEFVQNPYDLMANFNLGLEYEKENQLASGLSHYLRAAEFGVDQDIYNKKNLISESLLRAAECLNKLGGRHFSTKSCIMHAISNQPNIAQSYLLLSKVYEQTREWNECNYVCNIGLAMMHNFSPLMYDNKTEDDISNEFLFQKAVSNYHIGRTQLAKKEFLELTEKKGVQSWIKDASIRSLKAIRPK